MFTSNLIWVPSVVEKCCLYLVITNQALTIMNTVELFLTNQCSLARELKNLLKSSKFLNAIIFYSCITFNVLNSGD